MNKLILDDFVVLGRTVPEDSKKFGKKVCMAGYSPSLSQLLRVYPLMMPLGEHHNANRFKARHSYALELRRNPDDNRPESWRVADESNPTSTDWNRAAEVTTPNVIKWLNTRRTPSIKALNTCKLSLGALLVPADKWDGFAVERNAKQSPPTHASLFEDLSHQPDEVNRAKFAPYIRFTDDDGKHELQVREWGAYLLLSNPKHADKPEALWEAPAYRKGRDLMLVVGNMANHRNNWLIIKTFEIAKPDNTPGLFDDVPDEE